MIKPRAVYFAACVVALATVFGIVAFRDKRPIPNSTEATEPVVEPMLPEAAANATPHPRLLPSLVAPPKLPASTIPNVGKPLDETLLLTRLHELAASDPPLSLKLATEAAERFSDSPNAPEFEWNVVKALFNMGRLEEAKDQARIMLWKYPNSYYTGDVVRHLLNPPPNPSSPTVLRTAATERK